MCKGFKNSNKAFKYKMYNFQLLNAQTLYNINLFIVYSQISVLLYPYFINNKENTKGNEIIFQKICLFKSNILLDILFF